MRAERSPALAGGGDDELAGTAGSESGIVEAMEGLLAVEAGGGRRGDITRSRKVRRLHLSRRGCGRGRRTVHHGGNTA